MSRTVTVFWPGDYREEPNRLAAPMVRETTAQLTKALQKLGRKPKVIRSFLRKPHEAIDKLGPVDDPVIGVFCHWTYGPHTCEGVVGKDQPLLLASNFSGQWPGLVALLNTSSCLESVNRSHSRIWTDAADWTKDRRFMERLDEWCSSGRIAYDESELHYSAPVSPEAARIADEVLAEIRQRRVLALMLGDTSMGMINGYFGPRILSRIGFAEHKVDQAWLINRGRFIPERRIDEAFQFVVDHGVKFHWQENGDDDFTPESTRAQLEMYLTVLDLIDEFQADCLGWQYQLGLLPLLPPSDFCEGLLNSTCRPEGNGDLIITATEADQGNLIPMELMKRILLRRGMNPSVMFHDVRWGSRHKKRWLWVLLNSGSCGAYAFNHDPDTLRGVHSYRQPKGYFPVPGGTFAGESLPGEITWSRAYLRDDQLWMDIGRGRVAKLPAKTREAWWNGTTRQWPFMAADLGCSMETVMAHYQSNHVAVCYGDIFGEMVALSQALGFKVRIMATSL